MYAERLPLYRKLEEARDSKLIAYVTGDRPGLVARIASDVHDLVADHLDRIGVTPRISLYLYTVGGHTLAARTLTNMLRNFCDELEILIPAKAHSAGTLMALGAERIVMTRQATLGPIDPSVNGPLNPRADADSQAAIAVNVENVNAFLDFAREALGEGANLEQVFRDLAAAIHPMVLGQAYRSRAQIRRLGREMLRRHMDDDGTIDRILDFLCGESGSHDYTVDRREAADELGLPIETPEPAVDEVVREIYDDIAAELDLRTPYGPDFVLGDADEARYSLPRGLIESVSGGSHVVVREGVLTRQRIQEPNGAVRTSVDDLCHFQGWRHREG